ncbi:uncharacterized protein BROUX77_005996 [Berkeleyomyces rouxiae]|uniref:uncharacterized protein n=1 Tax=Berkeleyomyces rouxiae TaxID=2035830 RepID=UPI003B829BA5
MTAATATASHTTSTLTPPSSSHGHRNDTNSWDPDQDAPAKSNITNGLRDAYPGGYDGADVPEVYPEKRRPSPVNTSLTYERENGLRSPIAVDDGSFGDVFSQNQSHTRAQSRASERRSREKHADPVPSNGLPTTSDADKWIHRDKLAKIENAELQAAGIMLPKPRAASRRRDRSEHSHSRADDSRKNSMSADTRPIDIPGHTWDLRLPEEIREETLHSYWESPLGNGKGSRIPLARSSPAPIPTDFLDRDTPIGRSKSHDADLDPLRKSRSRSSSVKTNGDYYAFQQANGSTPSSTKRGSDNSSRKMSTTRKTSVPPRRSSSRPKTRGGKESNSTRPGTRSGDFAFSGGSSNKQPEGEPPWMISAYQPDPRLPPEEQLLPTVARRLQQEKWEKEGKFGTVYDKEFRPLNDESLLKPPERAAAASDTTQNEEPNSEGKFDEWPLKTSDIPRSPTVRSNSYSTMPKIVDKPPSSPISSPRGNNQMSFGTSRPDAQPQVPHEPHSPTHHTNPTPNHYQPQQQNSQHPQAQHVPHKQEQEQPREEKDGGCGCCIVM